MIVIRFEQPFLYVYSRKMLIKYGIIFYGKYIKKGEYYEFKASKAK